MIAIDLFAGAGGMSLGLVKAGFDVRAALEVDRHAASTYRRNHSAKVIEKSILGLDAIEFLDEAGIKKNEVVLIAGGPPCQGFSMANGHSRNHEKPYQDEKNQLVQEFIRFVDEIRPEIFIMENVLGFLSMQQKFSPPLVERFEPLGYKTEVFTLKAEEYGIPQKRRRVFVIGSKKQIDFDLDKNKKRSNYLTVKEALFGDLPHIRKGTEGYSMPTNYKDLTPSTEYQKYLRRNSRNVWNHVTTVSCKKVTDRFSKIAPGKNGVSLGSDIGIAIQFSSCYKRLKSNEPAITMSNFRKSMIMPPKEDRILSVREAARIQSFPDSYIFEGGISSMQQQVGNAVPPLLAEVIAKQLIGTLS